MTDLETFLEEATEENKQLILRIAGLIMEAESVNTCAFYAIHDDGSVSYFHDGGDASRLVGLLACAQQDMCNSILEEGDGDGENLVEYAEPMPEESWN